MLQSVQPVVEAWQIIGTLGSIALVVLTAYGTMILQNRGRVNGLRQRLFGARGDDTDYGFVQTTQKRLDELSDRQKQHTRQTHVQLYKLDQKMNAVLEVMAEEHDDVRMPRTIEDVDDVPPPPAGFYRGGGQGDPDGPWGSESSTQAGGETDRRGADDD